MSLNESLDDQQKSLAFFDRIKNEIINNNQGTATSSSQSDQGKLAGHRRERYEEDTLDVAFLSGNSSSNTMESNQVNKPVNVPNQVARLNVDPRDGTSSVQSGHNFQVRIPAPDPKNPEKKQYPVAIGYCLRGCGTHANSNPFNRECPKNPNVSFKNNQMLRTYTYVHKDDQE